ncbi:hypothetical protein B0H65DRAFT_67188 [Neurospora tetraspora]|uniref:Uncharacterized protein n=1 Tax=Neurospora tetraspora TaxID=94610 RepID=A0AAE0JQT2_9PEZI|nr:hypothetical protein B0H65DRAFT_67188 [Neurospora tetraspora]
MLEKAIGVLFQCLALVANSYFPIPKHFPSKKPSRPRCSSVKTQLTAQAPLCSLLVLRIVHLSDLPPTFFRLWRSDHP